MTDEKPKPTYLGWDLAVPGSDVNLTTLVCGACGKVIYASRIVGDLCPECVSDQSREDRDGFM